MHTGEDRLIEFIMFIDWWVEGSWKYWHMRDGNVLRNEIGIERFQ